MPTTKDGTAKGLAVSSPEQQAPAAAVGVSLSPRPSLISQLLFLFVSPIVRCAAGCCCSSNKQGHKVPAVGQTATTACRLQLHARMCGLGLFAHHKCMHAHMSTTTAVRHPGTSLSITFSLCPAAHGVRLSTACRHARREGDVQPAQLYFPRAVLVEKVHGLFNAAWQKGLKAGKPNIVWAVIANSLWGLIWTGLLYAVSLGCQLVGPLVLQRIVSGLQCQAKPSAGRGHCPTEAELY